MEEDFEFEFEEFEFDGFELGICTGLMNDLKERVEESSEGFEDTHIVRFEQDMIFD